MHFIGCSGKKNSEHLCTPQGKVYKPVQKVLQNCQPFGRSCVTTINYRKRLPQNRQREQLSRLKILFSYFKQHLLKKGTYPYVIKMYVWPIRDGKQTRLNKKQQNYAPFLLFFTPIYFGTLYKKLDLIFKSSVVYKNSHSVSVKSILVSAITFNIISTFQYLEITNYQTWSKQSIFPPIIGPLSYFDHLLLIYQRGMLLTWP